MGFDVRPFTNTPNQVGETVDARITVDCDERLVKIDGDRSTHRLGRDCAKNDIELQTNALEPGRTLTAWRVDVAGFCGEIYSDAESERRFHNASSLILPT